MNILFFTTVILFGIVCALAYLIYHVTDDVKLWQKHCEDLRVQLHITDRDRIDYLNAYKQYFEKHKRATEVIRKMVKEREGTKLCRCTPGKIK